MGGWKQSVRKRKVTKERNVTDLLAPYLSGNYCQKTGTRPSSCVTPQQRTIDLPYLCLISQFSSSANEIVASQNTLFHFILFCLCLGVKGGRNKNVVLGHLGLNNYLYACYVVTK